MNIEKVIREATEVSKLHGWKESEDTDRTGMLIISEFAELVQADRKGKRADLEGFSIGVHYLSKKKDDPDAFKVSFENHIKDTLEDEIADIIIRICSFFGSIGYNPTEIDAVEEPTYIPGHLKGYQYPIHKIAFELVAATYSSFSESMWGRLHLVCSYLVTWAHKNGIDIENHVELKNKYNRLRDYECKY